MKSYNNIAIKQHSNRTIELGFTLIEMIIVLAIISILTTLMIANLRGGEKKAALRRSAQEVALHIRFAQSMSLEAKNYPGGNEVPDAYGIHFQTSLPTEYILFADCDGGTVGVLDSMSSSTCPSAPSSQPEELSVLHLRENAKIDSLGSGITSIDITFVPPDPTTMIYKNGNPTSTQATIRLKLGDDTKTVVVTNTGQVDIQ